MWTPVKPSLLTGVPLVPLLWPLAAGVSSVGGHLLGRGGGRVYACVRVCVCLKSAGGWAGKGLYLNAWVESKVSQGQKSAAYSNDESVRAGIGPVAPLGRLRPCGVGRPTRRGSFDAQKAEYRSFSRSHSYCTSPQTWRKSVDAPESRYLLLSHAISVCSLAMQWPSHPARSRSRPPLHVCASPGGLAAGLPHVHAQHTR